MDLKDNVGVETTQTEVGAKAQDEKQTGQASSQVSAVWDKFKDADALAKAYGALQAEFTRRSQKLKELEREMENWKTENAALADGKENGAEKLRNRIAAKRAERKQFNEFVQELERANVGARAAVDSDNDVQQPVSTVDGEIRPMERELVSIDLQAEKTSNDETSSRSVAEKVETVENVDTLYQQAANNESVRRKIIGDYLASLGRPSAPLMRGGSGAFAAPPIKAKSIDEAGVMALRFFQKD